MNVTAQIAALTDRIASLEKNSFQESSASTWWLLSNGILVFFMQCGFGMLEAGAVTARGTQNILLKNLLDASISAVVWYSFGYGLAFGGENPFIGNPLSASDSSSSSSNSNLFLVKLLEEDATGFSTPNSASGYAWAFWWFQFTFAATAATIVSGAVAERAQLISYLIYSTFITLFIYPVVAHWVWSGSGWLSPLNPDAFLGGVIDFAGSGVVHVTGGVAALAGAYTIGPRRGRFVTAGAPPCANASASTAAACLRHRCSCCCERGGKQREQLKPMPMPGHSSVLHSLGTFILWMGWYGFNAGSTLSIGGSAPRTAARIFATTTLSASSGGITAVVLNRVRGYGQQWDVAAMCNGVLAGLVSITAGCATCPAWAAIAIGILGGCIFRFASWVVLEVLHIDDPLDAFAVHGACGAWGVLACALFSTDYYTSNVASNSRGGVVDGGKNLIGAALVFLAVTICWVGSMSLVMFSVLRRLGVLRIQAGMTPAGGGPPFDSSGHGGPFSAAAPLPPGSGGPYRGGSGACPITQQYLIDTARAPPGVQPVSAVCASGPAEWCASGGGPDTSLTSALETSRTADPGTSPPSSPPETTSRPCNATRPTGSTTPPRLRHDDSTSASPTSASPKSGSPPLDMRKLAAQPNGTPPLESRTIAALDQAVSRSASLDDAKT